MAVGDKRDVNLTFYSEVCVGDALVKELSWLRGAFVCLGYSILVGLCSRSNIWSLEFLWDEKCCNLALYSPGSQRSDVVLASNLEISNWLYIEAYVCI